MSQKNLKLQNNSAKNQLRSYIKSEVQSVSDSLKIITHWYEFVDSPDKCNNKKYPTLINMDKYQKLSVVENNIGSHVQAEVEVWASKDSSFLINPAALDMLKSSESNDNFTYATNKKFPYYGYKMEIYDDMFENDISDSEKASLLFSMKCIEQEELVDEENVIDSDTYDIIEEKANDGILIKAEAVDKKTKQVLFGIYHKDYNQKRYGWIDCKNPEFNYCCYFAKGLQDCFFNSFNNIDTTQKDDQSDFYMQGLFLSTSSYIASVLANNKPEMIDRFTDKLIEGETIKHPVYNVIFEEDLDGAILKYEVRYKTDNSLRFGLYNKNKINIDQIKQELVLS